MVLRDAREILSVSRMEATTKEGGVPTMWLWRGDAAEDHSNHYCACMSAILLRSLPRYEGSIGIVSVGNNRLRQEHFSQHKLVLKMTIMLN